MRSTVLAKPLRNVSEQMFAAIRKERGQDIQEAASVTVDATWPTSGRGPPLLEDRGVRKTPLGKQTVLHGCVVDSVKLLIAGTWESFVKEGPSSPPSSPLLLLFLPLVLL